MADPVKLSATDLPPVLLALERYGRAAKRHSELVPPPSVRLTPPLPACPTCGALPTKVTQWSDGPLLSEVRFVFEPCEHGFAADEEVAYKAAERARSLVDDEENRPAGERTADEKLTDWAARAAFPPARDGRDPNPAITEKLHASLPPEARIAVAEWEANAYRNQVQALIREMQHMSTEGYDHPARVIVMDGRPVESGTDMVLVGCEQHETRIAELATVLREVLARFVHDTHPGRRSKQTDHVNVETIARWQAVLNGEGE